MRSNMNQGHWMRSLVGLLSWTGWRNKRHFSPRRYISIQTSPAFPSGDLRGWYSPHPILHHSTGTLGARDFSSAVSGLCQVFIVTRAKSRSWLRPTAEDVSAFGQHRKFPPHARKTSGTQGRALDVTIKQWNINIDEWVSKLTQGTYLLHCVKTNNLSTHNITEEMNKQKLPINICQNENLLTDKKGKISKSKG